MAKAKTVDQTGQEVAPAAGALTYADRDVLLAQAVTLIEQVPEAGESDGTGILADILNAQSLDELQESGRMDNARDMAGRTIKVTGLTRRESDLDSDTGYYLIVDGQDMATDRPVRFSTSALGVVAVLAKLYSWHRIPAMVKITEADKPTKAGYRPLNVQVLGATLTESK